MKRLHLAERSVPRPRGLSPRLRSPVGLSILGKTIEAVTLALLVTLVPRALGPEAYGELSLALALVTLGSAALSLGGASLLARVVPAASPPERTALARSLALRLARSRAAMLLPPIALGTSLAVLAPSRFPPLTVALLLTALVLDVAATLCTQVALGLGRTSVWSFRWPLQNAALIAGVLVLAGLGSAGVLAGVTVASACSLVYAATGLRPLLGAPRGRPLSPEALRFGALTGASALLTLAQHRGPVLAVALLGSSSAERGYAALAAGGALAGTYAISQAFLVQLPGLSERVEHDLQAAEREARRFVHRAFLLVLPVSLALAAALDPLVRLVLGADFGGARTALAWALPLLPLAPLTALVAQVAALRLEVKSRVVASALGLGAFVAGVAIAVPAWQAAGAVASLLAGVLVTLLVSTVLMRGVLSLRLLGSGLAASALTLVLALGPP